MSTIYPLGSNTNNSGEKYITLTGADRFGNTCRTYIYLECEVDEENTRARVRIKRIMMDLWPRYYDADPSESYLNSSGKSDLYRSYDSTGSQVTINGQTLFNCTKVNQYGVNTQISYKNTYMGAVCPWSVSSPTSSNIFSTSFDAANWITYTGSKTITVTAFFSWATTGTYPKDTNKGINSSVNVTLPTIEEKKTWTGYAASIGTVTTQDSRSITLNEYQLYRTTCKFTTSGPAKFFTTGSKDTRGWLSTSSSFNKETGVPSTNVASNDDGGDNYNFSITYNVTANTSYYLFSRFYSEENTGTFTQKIYAPLLVTLNKGTGIASVTGGNTYTYNDSITVGCTLSSGYKFKGWYSDSSGTTLISSEQSYTFTLTSATTLYAIAELDSVDIKIEAGDNIAKVSYGDLSSSDSLTFTEAIGTSITIVATVRDYVDNEVISFKGWYDEDDNLISSSKSYTFEVEGPIHLIAKASVTLRYYDLTVEGDENVAVMIWQNNELITITDYNEIYTCSIPYRAKVFCSPVLNDGYQLKSIEENSIIPLKFAYPWTMNRNRTIIFTSIEKPKKEYIPIINSKIYIPMINDETYLPQIK